MKKLPQNLPSPKVCKATAEAEIYEQGIIRCRRQRIDGSVIHYAVNNREIAAALTPPLTAEGVQNLAQRLEEKGVFNLRFEHHLPCVTEAAGSLEMERKWPRDHIGMLPLIEARYPQEYLPGLEKWAEQYASGIELKALENVCRNPSLFLENGGIAHVFNLNNSDGTLIRDSHWINNQRIESHGELLRAWAEAALKYPNQISRRLLAAIVYFSHYLAVLGPEVSTCGPWEEITLPKGSNWDTATVYFAFEKVLKLFQSPLLPQLQQIENDWKFSRRLFDNPSGIMSYRKQAAALLRANRRQEFRGITERTDACTVMLAAEDFDWSGNGDIAANLAHRIEQIESTMAKLLGEYGCRRYNSFELQIGSKHIRSADSYLNLDYNLNGGTSSDASQPDEFCRRGEKATDETAAQWGLPLSYAALAYARMEKQLLSFTGADNKLKQLAAQCRDGAEEFLCRSLGNICGLRPDGGVPIKANGEPALPWRKPEAYQAVSKPGGGWGFLPGVNSHLGWDAAKFYEALQLFRQNLQQ